MPDEIQTEEIRRLAYKLVSVIHDLRSDGLEVAAVDALLDFPNETLPPDQVIRAQVRAFYCDECTELHVQALFDPETDDWYDVPGMKVR
jgi:hypothetical protein